MPCLRQVFRFCAATRLRQRLLLLVVAALSGCASVPQKQHDVCEIFKQKPYWYGNALSVQERWGTPLALSMAILQRESSFRARAKPPRTRILWVIPWKRPSSAYGYSQALDGTWAQYQKATGEHGHDRNDFADSINFIGWYTDQTHRRNRVAKTDAYRQYLNYHEGWGGYQRGSYQKKPKVQKVAKQVEARAREYAKQYRACHGELKLGFWQRVWGY